MGLSIRKPAIVPRGRVRIWLIFVLFVFVTVAMGVVNHTPTYNKVANSVNSSLEDVGTPDFLRLPGGKDYSLGLDLVGGIRLVYALDVSGIEGADAQAEAVRSLRDVIERRVNILGVREPLVQIQGVVPDARLIVELSDISDPEQAKEEIGKTPLLEFKELREEDDAYYDAIAEKYTRLFKEQQTQEQTQDGQSDIQEITVRTGPADEEGNLEIIEQSAEGVSNSVTIESPPPPPAESGDTAIEEVRGIEEIELAHIAPEHNLPTDEGGNQDDRQDSETVNDQEQSGADSTTDETNSGDVEVVPEEFNRTGADIRAMCSSAGQEGSEAVFLRFLLQQEDGDDYEDPCFVSSGLDGRYLDKAEIRIDDLGSRHIALNFNKEGGDLFEEITDRNTGEPLAIFLDNQLINSPTIQEKISGGSATITGNFSLPEARELVSNLNAGALPVPITALAENQIGPNLGKQSVDGAMQAGIFGIIAVFVFMILVYRLSGMLAVLSLIFYIATLLFVIKMLSITLTLAGVAGIILSIGMAVDANVLVFERLREELKTKDKSIPMRKLIDSAFRRTWSAVLDGNLSTIITAMILYLFSTNFIKGFAVTLGIGVVLSMFSAMVITKYLMYLFSSPYFARKRWLWSRILKHHD